MVLYAGGQSKPRIQAAMVRILKCVMNLSAPQ